VTSPKLIRGGTVVDEGGTRRADVLIDGERISAVGSNLDASGAEVLDATGALVLPGAIDVHTHFDLPVGAVRSADDFESGTAAAACGGTTCVVDFAGAGRESPQDALASWHEKAKGRAAVDYGFHLTVTTVPDDPAQVLRLFASFVAAGVTSVKLYMAYPERLMVDDETLGRAFTAGAATGVRVCVHAEDGNEIQRLTEDAVARGQVGPAAIPSTRPPSVEADAILRAADLATDAGASVYVVHLSSAAGLDAVHAVRERGGNVLAETCPQYLFLTADSLSGPAEAAADFVCAPPLRGEGDHRALWEGLADGTLAVAATDHCPFTRADRAHGTAADGDQWIDFRQIPGGLPGVETRLSLTYQGVREGRLPLGRWVDAVAGAPARLFGLAGQKGSVTPGLDADVVVFDPGAHRRLGVATLHSRSDHSPFEGREVIGWPAITFSRGRVVAREGEPVDVEPGWGRFVRRKPVDVAAGPGR
jgi:dihydropyrimidinase